MDAGGSAMQRAVAEVTWDGVVGIRGFTKELKSSKMRTC